MRKDLIILSYQFERTIHYYETDKMGIVHHSNYIRFLEEARCAFLTNQQMPYSYFEEQGVMIPVLGVNCDYKQHVTFNDTIVISVSVKEFNGVRLTMSYVITDKNTGNTVLTGETKHCFTDTHLRPIRLQKQFPVLYGNFMNLL